MIHKISGQPEHFGERGRGRIAGVFPKRSEALTFEWVLIGFLLRFVVQRRRLLAVG
jgi:hypothetical protein